LEVLKTNEALVEQRIHVFESDAKITLTLNASQADAVKAAQITREIESQNAKLAQAEAEAARYSGGLAKELADASVATSENTLALLEQQYLVEHYGIAIPTSASPASTLTKSERTTVTEHGESIPAPKTETTSASSKDCLKINTFDSSVLSVNEVYTELAWKADVSNSCDQPFAVRVTFKIYDKAEFELDSDSKDVYVDARGIGKARGKMLISPAEKARRISKQGVDMSER
jgi:hypothetical protein